MATFYAWSNFPVEFNEWGQPTKTITVGMSVSQSDLGISDSDWQDLVDVGAVREDKYPDIPDNVAPAEYFKDHPEEDPAMAEVLQAQEDAAAAQAEVDATVEKEAAKAEKSTSSSNKTT